MYFVGEWPDYIENFLDRPCYRVLCIGNGDELFQTVNNIRGLFHADREPLIAWYPVFEDGIQSSEKKVGVLPFLSQWSEEMGRAMVKDWKDWMKESVGL